MIQRFVYDNGLFLFKFKMGVHGGDTSILFHHGKFSIHPNMQHGINEFHL